MSRSVVTPPPPRATRPLRLARLRAGARASLRALVAEFDHDPVPAPGAEVVVAVRRALAALNGWSVGDVPPRSRRRPVRLVERDT